MTGPGKAAQQEAGREAAIQAAVEAESLARSIQNRLAYGKDVTSKVAEMQIAVQRISALQATITGPGLETAETTGETQ